MADFADAFDAELRSPTLMFKTAALPVGGLVGEFKRQATHAGPALALFGAVPDVVGSGSAYMGLRDAAKEDPDAPGVDEQGNPISPEEHKKQLKKKKKELAGGVGAGIGSAVGNIAGWMIPGGAEAKGLAFLVRGIAAPMAVGMGGGWAGRQVGQVLG